jgi:hypothetical protein
MRSVAGVDLLVREREACRDLASSLVPSGPSDALLMCATGTHANSSAGALASMVGMVATAADAWAAVVEAPPASGAAAQAVYALLHLADAEDSCRVRPVRSPCSVQNYLTSFVHRDGSGE